MANPRDVIVGVDLGGTSMRALLVGPDYQVLGEDKQPTNPKEKPDKLIAEIANVVEQAVERAGVKMRAVRAVSIGAPGAVDSERGIVFEAPNLRWRDVDIRNPIAKATGLEVELENAANACVLASVWFDHMEGCRNLVVVTVSEGIGTGILANGQLVRGLGGMAGEFGHVPIDPKGPPCGCGGRGCWETFASNRAAVRYYQEAGAADAKETGLGFMDLLNRADHGDT